MLSTRFSRVGPIAIALALVLAASGCTTGRESTPAAPPPANTDGPITISFIQKQGDQQYFLDERAGAEAQAKQMQGSGREIKINFVDVGTDANAAINAINQAVALGVSGVAIVVPDAKIGPQVAETLRRANIPFVATDDPFEDGAGKRVAWVSIESLTMGRQVGERAGKLVKTAGWTPANTRILSVKQEDLGVCLDREKGYLETFQAQAGMMPEVVRVGTDNSTPEAQAKVGAALTANDDVTNWVVMGCNDESVSGALLALGNAGKKPESIIGVGLGAYLACKDWRAGKQSGFRASLNVDGRVNGAASIKVLVEHLRDGKPIPETTLGKAVMVDPENWEASGVKCS